MTKIAELKPEPRNHEALQLLEALIEKVRENPDATEVMALVKIGPNYHRFSTGVKDMVTMVGMLELAKVDCIQRMGD